MKDATCHPRPDTAFAEEARALVADIGGDEDDFDLVVQRLRARFPAARVAFVDGKDWHLFRDHTAFTDWNTIRDMGAQTALLEAIRGRNERLDS